VFSWAVLYFPPVSRVLGTGPVAMHVYFLACLGILLIYGLDYFRKKIACRSKNPHQMPVSTP